MRRVRAALTLNYIPLAGGGQNACDASMHYAAVGASSLFPPPDVSAWQPGICRSILPISAHQGQTPSPSTRLAVKTFQGISQWISFETRGHRVAHLERFRPAPTVRAPRHPLPWRVALCCAGQWVADLHFALP